MKDYKRLTKQDWHNAKFSVITHEGHRIVLYRLWELENRVESGELCDREEARKETAREILKPLCNVIMEHPDCCVNLSEDIKFLMEKYGIDLENEE